MDYRNPNVGGRRSVRLAGYDYSQPGAYFVTIAIHDRELLFGQIVDDTVTLKRYGKIALFCWEAIPTHFHDADASVFVIMPDHIHGIVVIDLGTACRAPTGRPPFNGIILQTNTAFFADHCTFVQICHDQANQRFAPLARGYGLAARLVRTCCSFR